MTWERFHYVCRRHLRGESGRADFGPSAAYYRSDENSDLYGGPAPVRSLPRYIVSELESMTDTDRRTAAISLYADMDFSTPMRDTLRVKRSLAYVAIVMAAYLVLASVYTLFVFPSFLPFFEEAGALPPPWAQWYLEHWHLPVSVVALLTLLIGLTAYQLNALFAFKHAPGGLESRSLVLPRRIKQSYTRLVALIAFPVENAPEDNALAARIRELIESGLDLRKELPVLIKIHGDEFTRLSNRYVQTLIALLGVIAIVTVAFFLISAYTPIFGAGDLI